MDKIKLKDKKVGAIIEVNKNVASDYLATGNYEIYNEVKTKPSFYNQKIKVEETEE